MNPDLVVHLGDLSLDGAHNPADLGPARRQLELLAVPCRAVPGNHDVGADPPALVVSGHVHQSRRLSLGGVDYLWVPTTWAVLPDHAQPVLGSKRTVVMSLTFGPGPPPSPKFAEPDGIRQLTVTADIPGPYHSH